MTQKIRFHLDENVSNAIAEGLRRRGIDVTTTPEKCPFSTLKKGIFSLE